MGWEILLGDQYSLFEDGNASLPKRDMSTVMIHELGHSLGLPHPHSGAYGWASSFIDDVMSYFATAPYFSSFYKDAIGRAHSDAHYLYALEEEATLMLYYYMEDQPEKVNDLISEINQTLLTAYVKYQQMDYNASVSLSIYTRSLIVEALNIMRNLNNYVYLSFLVIIIIPIAIITTSTWSSM